MNSEAKHADHMFEVVDLDTIIDDVKKDFEHVIAKNKVIIEYTPLCEAIIIQIQFRQLIHNLFSNSFKFTRPPITPHIKIESETIKWSKSSDVKLESQKMYCHITYTDNGNGFDPNVFRLFNNRDEYKGLGAGLSICKRIIENHQGAIYVSGKVNLCTRFDIYIPA